MKKRLVIFGSGSFGLPAFAQLAQAQDIDLVAVVSQPDKPAGRRHDLRPTPVSTWATENKLPLLQASSLRSPGMIDQLSQLRADTFLVADFGLILPKDILLLPGDGSVNIHASLLPRYRGASPITSAILDGLDRTGVTFMLMDQGMDTGPLLAQYDEPMTGHETRPELEERLAGLAADHILDVLSGWWQKRIIPQVQPTSGASLAKKISTDDGQASWESAVIVERKLRAFTPWPAVWTTWHGQRLKLLSAQVQLGQPKTPPGTVEPAGHSWKISCRDGWVVPIDVQMSGKRPQPAERLPGSYPSFVGSQLGS